MGETSTSKTKTSETKINSFVDRLIGKATVDIEKPEPTFFKDEPACIEDTQWSNLGALRKPLGLAKGLKMQTRPAPTQTPTPTPTENYTPAPERETRGKRLSRNELEAMLDQFYETSDKPTPPSTQTPRLRDGKVHHAQKAGNRMIQKMAMASSVALLLGFGVGLYSLSSQGGDTVMGKKLNQAIANMGTSVASLIMPQTKGSEKIEMARKAWTTQGSGQGNSQGVQLTKPVKTASLVVADASGTIAVGIPLKLKLDAPVGNSFVEIIVNNVPADAVLTAGTRQDNGVWVLKPNELSHVKLVLSSEQSEPLRLDIELVEAKTGELLTPPRVIKVSVISMKPFKVGGL